jgi:hypothetical protein
MTQDVSRNFSDDLGNLLLAYLNLKDKSRTQEDSPIKMGRIVDNKDPQKLGRCKVMVFHAFEELPDSDLPWATPEYAAGLGSFIVPEVGSLVCVYFRNNDPSNPVYSKQFLNSNNLSPERDEDYPNTMVLFETSVGEYLKINKKTNETVYRHASGVIVTFDKNGNVTIDTTNASTGNVKMDVRGNIDIDATGTINIHATGTITVDSSTMIEVDAPIIMTPAGNVAPTGTGGLCAMPIDPLTGLPQVGTILIRT